MVTNETAALSERLHRAGIDLSRWGQGGAKTIEDLQKEIEDGETVLIFGDDGSVLRKIEVIGADVRYTTPTGQRLRLQEEKQVFSYGRERRRNFTWAVSEKMKPGEAPRTAAVRGIQEELGIRGTFFITETTSEHVVEDSISYPGLMSEYTTHYFRVELAPEQFKSEGYIEVQSGITTYFVWKEIG